MQLCLNTACDKPQNPDTNKFCQNCGSKLLLGDRYRLLKVISQGGKGRTFLAVDESYPSKPRCTIKEFLPKNQGTINPQKASELFNQEVTRLAELSQHPQIPQLLGYFEIKERQYLVQEFIDGQSLAQQLAIEGAFSETQIRELLNELLPILQFVHDRGVIHRDINPENIIRRPPDSQLVLVDFGAAKITTKTVMAKPGTVIGSAAYTAPEQLMGQAFFASDLYSLGVSCIHLITQIHPFDLYNNLDRKWGWQDYLTSPVSKELAKILNKLLATTPKDRYQSGSEVLKALNPALIPRKPAAVALKLPIAVPICLTPSWKCVETFYGHLSSIHAIAFNPNNQTIASASADKTIKVWNLDGTGLALSLSGHLSLIDAVAFSPDGRTLASGSWDYAIKIWYLGAGYQDESLVTITHTLREHTGWIRCVAISPDGESLVSGSEDKTIKIWNLATGELGKTLFGHSSAVNAIAISPNGKIIVTGSADKSIKIWNLATGELLYTIEGHSDEVNSIAISPGGQIIFSGSADNTINKWNLGSDKLLGSLSGHSSAVKSVAISRQGTIFVSGSADKTIKIWHPGSGELIDTLSGHSDAVTAVAISPDGRAIASGSQDKTIKIWRFE